MKRFLVLLSFSILCGFGGREREREKARGKARKLFSELIDFFFGSFCLFLVSLQKERRKSLSTRAIIFGSKSTNFKTGFEKEGREREKKKNGRETFVSQKESRERIEPTRKQERRRRKRRNRRKEKKRRERTDPTRKNKEEIRRERLSPPRTRMDLSPFQENESFEMFGEVSDPSSWS